MLPNLNHTQISNCFIDEWMSSLSGAEIKVFLAISRKTIGWHKETDRISLSQIMEMTGLSKQGAVDSISNLEKIGLLVVERSHRGNTYSIRYAALDSQESRPDEKDASQLIRPEIVNSLDQTSQLIRPEIVNSVDTQKKDKETNKRNIKEMSDEVKNFVQWFYDTMQKTTRMINKPPDLKKWCKPIDLLNRVDGIPFEKMKTVAIFALNDSFWKGNILSTDNFREKFDRLEQQSKRTRAAPSDSFEDKRERAHEQARRQGLI